MQIVRIVNEGNKKFTGKYGGVKTIIAPGEEALVQIEAGILWCGDPDTRDIDRQNKNRTFEYERIAGRYGSLGSRELFEVNKPKIGMFLTDGTRLNTILDDPFNEKGVDLQLGGEIPRTDDQAGVRAEKMLNKLIAGLENSGIDIAALLAGELVIDTDDTDQTDDDSDDELDDDDDADGVTTTTATVTKKVASRTAKKTAAAKKAGARPSAGAQRPTAPRTDG